MNPEKIDLFFTLLDKKLQQPAEIIIIGAAAGSLMGHIRPSIDIDFEIRLRHAGVADAVDLYSITDAINREIQIAAQYSDDVGHWSMINFLNYRETAIPYKTFGQLSVKLIAPNYWTIGKMGRYFAPDIADMIAIIKHKKLSRQDMIDTWRRARDSSGLSLEVRDFQSHVIDFLKTHGKEVWGSGFNADEAVAEFKKRN
jgi:hypothetical protein